MGEDAQAWVGLAAWLVAGQAWYAGGASGTGKSSGLTADLQSSCSSPFDASEEDSSPFSNICWISVRTYSVNLGLSPTKGQT